ncbi:MAG: glycoside hydrolase family 2 TIM barrel-domain containing protein [Verrucomicrobiota bacterium]
MKNPKLWTPEQPHLYDLTVQVTRKGQVVDKVGSYFGMRSIAKAFVDGHQRVLLNGQPIFMFGPLDQGFWPDGCYTAPTDAALKYDLEVIKQLGFNTVRKHIKVEPARWYYYADKLGLLVWQDMPSVNSYDTPPAGRPTVEAVAYETQLQAMIKNLENHPAIVMWIVFNESQGKHNAIHLVKLAQELDPSRLVNEDSGHQDGGGRYEGVGDLFDEHPYPAPRGYNSPDARAFVLGEYGGIGLKMGNNPWQSKGWGYTTTKTSEELENLYARYAGMLRQFRDQNGLVGAIYTQITDVEIEVNGLMTYDRQLKVDPELIAKANRFEWSGPVFTSIVPNSENAAPVYQYTFTKPEGGWMMPAADTSGWQQGPGGFGVTNTPGIGRIGTAWNTSDIWLRRTFTLPQLSQKQIEQLVLNLHHDDDVQIFINGVMAYEKIGWESSYALVSISAAAKQTLKLGAENVIAIHCHQTGGGQYVDVGLGTLDPNRPGVAQASAKPLQTPHHFARTVKQKQALDYLLFLPRDYSAKRAEGWPLILFLHGSGERGTNVFKVTKHGPPKQVESNPDFPCVLVSPQCPEGKTWDVSELTGLLDEVIAKHNIDTNRVYLTGLSMGGYGTWSLGLAHPERFAALAPICGGGERRSVSQAIRTKGDIVRKLPIWAFHGAKDPVVPLEESERMVNALKSAGARM